MATRERKTRKATAKALGARTLVTLLLDRSGSMQSLKDDTIGAINAYRAQLRASGQDIRYSQVHFDTHHGHMELARIHVAERIAEVPEMTAEDYQPRGSTPLIDATCATIRAVADALAADPAKGEATRVVIAIQTDGQENASEENDWEGLKALIAEKEKAGWEFVFMGAGIDAYAQGGRMGLDRGKILSYGTDRAQTEAAFAATAMNTAAFASGALRSVSYSAEQKKAAGDTR